MGTTMSIRMAGIWGIVLVAVMLVPMIWWYKALLAAGMLLLGLLLLKLAGKWRQLSGELEQSKQRLRAMSYDMQVAADRLGAAMEEVNRHSQGLQRTADDTQRQEGRLRARSTSAMHHIESAFVMMNDVTELTAHIQRLSDGMQQQVAGTKDVVMEIVQDLQSTDRVMGEMKLSNEMMWDNIQDLLRYISHIEAMNADLVGIVEETSLLALNASIESARAGEAGRGFAVVAGRIRQLADQSKGAVARSSQLLDNVTQGVNQVVASVEKEKESVAQGLDEIMEVKQRLELIYDKVIDVHSIVGQAVDFAHRQAELIHVTADGLQQAVGTIGETIGDLDHTLEYVSKQREQIEELGAVSDNLLKDAEELSSALQESGELGEGSGHSSQQVEALVALVKSIAAEPGIQSLELHLHERLLKAYMMGNAGIQAIWSNREDGTFIFSEPKAGLLNAKHRDWWQGAMREGTYVSRIYISAITKRPCMTIAAAITDASGRRIGVVGLDLSVE
ncbi:methyl-accepting chemotaxis protein [Paenibacillus sp. YYML68]|uniref:methyl-accepting chemotaxis protein n=1 Tax=Paenibacillus sp. YYML68 TaxID=2909250 RepID=UPI002493BF91|nr:methyl-accepting chemotaxis protein [Paenibacillus sp. YYML68]